MTARENEGPRESVQPDRDESTVIEEREDPGNPDQRAGMQHRQAEQNQDQNDRYDPTNGKRPDQRRRNDKRGQMGG